MLAFDHRDAFRALFPPQRVAEAKRLVYEGFLLALDRTRALAKVGPKAATCSR